MDVFCVFEGGGAKGVAHVGFLRSLDKHDGYTARGYAGTSAGAILAALAAAGWKGNELFSECDDGIGSEALNHISQQSNRTICSLADLLTPQDWKKLSWLKEQLNGASVEDGGIQANDIGRVVAGYISNYLKLLGVVFVLTILGGLLLSEAIWIIGLLVFLLMLLPVVPAAAALKYLSSRFSGVASMDVPREMLEKLLQYKVPKSDGSEVTFRDIKLNKGHSLNVVAADLESGNLKLFGTDSTPDVSVARAVTASASIPLLFKPVVVEGRQYCDGGIVSNLPAWAFDSERLNNEECLTITCQVSPLKDRLISRHNLRGFRLFSRVAVTTLFGGADLNTRGMLRLLPLSAWHSIRMLDFEKTSEQVELIKASEEQADIKLDLERLHRTGIEGLRARIVDLLADNGIRGCSLRVAYARNVNLVDAPPAAYHLWNCAGFDGFPDRNITLPATDSLIGECITAKEPRWFDLTNPEIKDRYFGVGAGALAGRLATDRSWMAIIPIEEHKMHERVSLAVCVDCDAPFEHGEVNILREISDLVREFT